jgi:voltage-gated potassium channel
MKHFILGVPLMRQVMGGGMTKTVKNAFDTLGEILIIYVVLMFVFAGIFSLVEGQPYSTSLYWAGITAPTVGYGDVTPKTGIGMAISIIYAHVGIVLVAMFTTRLLMKAIDDQNEWSHDEQEDVKAKLDYLCTQIAELSERIGPHGVSPSVTEGDNRDGTETGPHSEG